MNEANRTKSQDQELWLPHFRREIVPDKGLEEFVQTAKGFGYEPFQPFRFDLLTTGEMHALQRMRLIGQAMVSELVALKASFADEPRQIPVIDAIVWAPRRRRRLISLDIEPDETVVYERNVLLGIIRKFVPEDNMPSVFQAYVPRVNVAKNKIAPETGSETVRQTFRDKRPQSVTLGRLL